MPLPVIQQPIYEVYLKSLDKKVRFRPFLVKEEKLFLMSKETDEELAIVNSIKQVINNCCLDELDLDTLPTFDVELAVRGGEQERVRHGSNRVNGFIEKDS